MIKKIDHFVITTEHMKHCVAFYEQLGFHAVEDGTCTILYAGDFKINVHRKGAERLPHAHHIQCGSGDFCFELDSPLEIFYTELKAKGLIMETEIVSRYGVKGAMKSFYLRDPDGTLIELCSYK